MTRPTDSRPIARGAGLLLACVLGAGCRGDDDPAVVRLAFELEPANVGGSPLLEAPRAADIGAIAERPVFATEFDTETVEGLRWVRRAPWSGSRFETLPGGERAWCHGSGTAEPQPLLLAAEPSRRYRFRRTLTTNDPSIDLEILERSTPLREPGTLNAPIDVQEFRRARRAGLDALQVHRFPVPGRTGEWVRDELDVLASRQARSFAVLFSTSVQGAAGGSACVDRLAAVELVPTAGQELALLAAAWSADAPGAATGIVKRGQLLGLPRASEAEPPFDRNLDHRDVLFAPTPTVLRFPLRVPEGGRLTLAYGLAHTARRGDRATFRVLVEDEDGGATEVLANERRQTGGAGLPWQEAEVSLERWARRTVVLVLRTEGRSDPPVHAVWGSPMIDRPRRPDDPPNVVLIGIDTLRADAVSSYGAARPTTPHLDRLAAEGVRFADVATVAPWTVPSFASIFTGLMPSRHGAIDRLTPLAPELTTLAERLRDAGWRTHAVAYKPFLYNLGFDQGFDDWSNVPRLDRTAEDVATRAIEVLERHHDRRFFLFLHFDDPHQPMRPPAAFGNRFVAAGALEHFAIALPYDFKLWPGVGCGGCRPHPENGPDYRELTRAVYDGAVAFTDDRIGAFFAALRARGVYDDTLIAVVSDHGETLWDRGEDFGHGHFKQEVLRAVMMIKPQRGTRLRPGTVIASPVRTTDLAPTVLDLVGLDPGPAAPDSRSLMALARGAAAASPVVVAENPRVRMLAVRRGDWKYVTRFAPESAPREELYDLAGDPAERTNVATQQPTALAELRADLLDHVLRNRGGTYLVALGEGGPRRWEIEIAAAGRDLFLQSLAGLAPRPGAGERRILGGPAEGRLLALVELAGAGDGPIEAWLRADGAEVTRLSAARGMPLPRDFSAAALLRRPGPALHLLSVPPGAHAPPPAAESAENLEQLRGLGYIE